MAKSVISELLQIFKSGVSAVLPDNLIRRVLKYNPVSQQLTICGDTYNLQNRNVYLVGTGKAVRNMAMEVENILGSKIKKGIVSIPEGSLEVISETVSYCQGAKHNLPDLNSITTTRKICDLVTGLEKDDLLIVLISGGGSALLTLPKPPITLEEKSTLIKDLANSGADIKELNIVRKKLSDIKGGKLAIKAQPAEVVSLILSDIVGDPIDLIASGPTLENRDDPAKALDIVEKYNLFTDLPDSIKNALREMHDYEQFPEDNVKNYLIGSNKIGIEAAVDEARSFNYIPIALSNTVVGVVEDVAVAYTKLIEAFCELLREGINSEALRLLSKSLDLPDLHLEIADGDDLHNKDLCLILGGETTVYVKGSGKGGRNQQLALEFAKNCYELKENYEGYDVYLLSAGTDGADGPTDAAGAIGYLDLVPDAEKEKLDVRKYVKEFDSYNFYKEFMNGNLHVITGHTNTNIMDLHIIIIKKAK
ncbi:glycerate kinase [Pectinophora gossypiella]|uniref:glycerate kinase n=1 Tax=Pectinophora gossypiella TaxID=13191 RepID=UPI00214F1BB9|nr:glycerate kinase [Pectinophora gossypiella]